MKEKIERVIMTIILVALFVSMFTGLVVVGGNFTLGAAMIVIPLIILLIFSQDDGDER